mgnify:CR=1 FL=1
MSLPCLVKVGRCQLIKRKQLSLKVTSYGLYLTRPDTVTTSAQTLGPWKVPRDGRGHERLHLDMNKAVALPQRSNTEHQRYLVAPQAYLGQTRLGPLIIQKAQSLQYKYIHQTAF